MEVMKKCKLVLRCGNLSNKNGFQIFKWRIPNFLVDFVFLLPMIICSIQMLIFCFRIGLVLKNISSAIYLFLGIASISAMYVCLAGKNELIIASLDQLQDMVSKRIEKSSLSMELYCKEENRHDKLMKILIVYSTFVIITVYVPPLLLPIGYATLGFPSPKNWYLPYPTATPFDTKQALGFYVVLTLQCLSGMSYMLIISLFSGFHIGMCTYIGTCVTDLSTFTEEINRIASNKKPLENRRKLDDIIREMIQLHVDTLQLMENLKKIMNGPLFFQLLVYAVFIAMNLLQFEETFRHFSLNILLNFNSFFTQILFNYISCYYANNVTMKSFAAAEIAYDMEWYKLPVQNRLFVQRMIQRAQKPFYLKGYDIVDCSLSTFLNFFRTAVSYFLIFKRVGN